jgi:pimeloyl-ACP methyl ester carboxylesterase
LTVSYESCVIGDFMAHTISPLLRRVLAPVALKASFGPAPVSQKKFADLPVAMTLRPSQVRATAGGTALMVPPAIAFSKRYSELDLPIIAMAGDGDLIAQVGEHAEPFAGEVGAADLRIVERQGHLFHYVLPNQVVAAIRDVHRLHRLLSARDPARAKDGASLLPVRLSSRRRLGAIPRLFTP